MWGCDDTNHIRLSVCCVHVVFCVYRALHGLTCVVILCHAGLYVLTLVAKTNVYCYLRSVYEFLIPACACAHGIQGKLSI